MGGSPLDGIDPAQVERFARDLDALTDAQSRIGLAVSGGPDSIAMLLLAATAFPDRIEAASVDHGLRSESRDEAELVARLCGAIGVPHAILTVAWPEKPDTGLQQAARKQRYAMLSHWAAERGLGAIVTAHHRDDQAETFMMRLLRGAGVNGLAGMRAASRVPGGTIPLLRPLLGWSRSELGDICASAEVAPALDPTNADERFERVRMRNALASAPWLDPQAIAVSAAHLAQAEEALAWAAEAEWAKATVDAGQIRYAPRDVPRDIRRRIAARAIAQLASEGDGNPLRGPEIDKVLAALDTGSSVTLRGVLCTGGAEWRFIRAPARRL